MRAFLLLVMLLAIAIAQQPPESMTELSVRLQSREVP